MITMEDGAGRPASISLTPARALREGRGSER